jgi:predicted dienelactone hydrolase
MRISDYEALLIMKAARYNERSPLQPLIQIADPPVRMQDMRIARPSRNGFTLLGFIIGSVINFGSAVWPMSARAEDVLQSASYKAGMTQLEYVDPSEGGRPLNLMLIYPVAPATTGVPFKLFLSTNLHLYRDVPVVSDGVKHPLVMFSHGAGGNGAIYAWFGEYLASHGYLVAMVYHFRANTYDSSALYVRNKIWQRPHDLSLMISDLLQDKVWGPHIDPGRIGVAGHSQGGFTSLWIGGAEVNADLFIEYQRSWKNNEMVPAYIREKMKLDAEPARHLRDDRVRAAFAMAPGDIQGFGMDESGLRQMTIPVYIIVGAGDTTTPSNENAAFAARHIPHAHLDVLPGRVGHEIFDNECDQIGRDNYPEACNDAPGVDRAKLHGYIGEAALQFFDSNLHVQRDRSK